MRLGEMETDDDGGPGQVKISVRLLSIYVPPY